MWLTSLAYATIRHMKIYRHFHKAPIRVSRISKRRFRLRLKRDMLMLQGALAQEKQETIEMLEIYKRYTKKQASKKELAEANQQFADLLKGLGLGVVAMMPFAPITIPIVVKIARYAGVEVLPSSFNYLGEKPEKR